LSECQNPRDSKHIDANKKAFLKHKCNDSKSQKKANQESKEQHDMVNGLFLVRGRVIVNILMANHMHLIIKLYAGILYQPVTIPQLPLHLLLLRTELTDKK
jgi:hypothetical protein